MINSSSLHATVEAGVRILIQSCTPVHITIPVRQWEQTAQHTHVLIPVQAVKPLPPHKVLQDLTGRDQTWLELELRL